MDRKCEARVEANQRKMYKSCSWCDKEGRDNEEENR